MEIEVVIAKLLKVLGIREISPPQYQEMVRILFKLEIPRDLHIPKTGEKKNEHTA